MFVTMIQSTFFMPIDLLTLGTGLSLQLAHEESFKAVFVGSLAIWTGFWRGTSLNAKILKFIFRDQVQKLIHRSVLFSSVDYACANHGLKIMLLLRFCPIYALNLVIQLMSLMGIPFKHFVLGGFTAIFPILI